MSQVRVVTDSATDLSSEQNKLYGIDVVPLRVRFGTNEFVDVVELTKEEFWRLSAAASELPQTSAPSQGDFEKTFQSLIEDGAEEILCINLSSDLSATYLSAQLAAEANADKAKIEVFDSRTVSLGQGIMAIQAARLAREGMTLESLKEEIATWPAKTRTFGTLDTLDSLKKGGRIGAAQALLGSLLSFKPVIEVVHGVVEAESKQRTRSRAIAYLLDKIASYPHISHLGVITAFAPETESFVEELRKRTGIDDIVVANIGPIIGTHAGPRTLGITFWQGDEAL